MQVEAIGCLLGWKATFFSGNTGVERELKKNFKYAKQKYNEIRQMLHQFSYLYSKIKKNLFNFFPNYY